MQKAESDVKALHIQTTVEFNGTREDALNCFKYRAGQELQMIQRLKYQKFVTPPEILQQQQALDVKKMSDYMTIELGYSLDQLSRAFAKFDFAKDKEYIQNMNSQKDVST
jgi:hypothetical protein